MVRLLPSEFLCGTRTCLESVKEVNYSAQLLQKNFYRENTSVHEYERAQSSPFQFLFNLLLFFALSLSLNNLVLQKCPWERFLKLFMLLQSSDRSPRLRTLLNHLLGKLFCSNHTDSSTKMQNNLRYQIFFCRVRMHSSNKNDMNFDPLKGIERCQTLRVTMNIRNRFSQIKSLCYHAH